MNLFELSQAESSEFPQPTTLAKDLWTHQRAALEYVVRQRRVLIGDEVGVGKTAVAIAALEALNAYPALVTPTAKLRLKWQRDLKTFVPHRRVRIVRPGEPFTGFADEADVFIVSHNLLQTHQKTILKMPIRGWVGDEGHKFRNGKAKRSKAAARTAMGVPLRLLLTATPVERVPADLVSQLEIIDQIHPFTSSWHFLQHFCNVNGDYVKSKDKWKLWELDGARNLAELNQTLRSHCYVMRTKEQVHKNLPPLTNARLDCEIANGPVYSEAEEDFLGWLASVDPEAMFTAAKAESLVRLNYLKRLASEGKREWAAEWVEDFREEAPQEQLVIFTILRDSAKFFAERFGAPMIIGGMSDEKSDRYIQEFLAKKFPVLVVSVQAGGEGHDMYSASNCLFFEMDWLPTTHTQAAGRLHRPGQENPVTAWWLVANGTVEEDIFALLSERQRVVADATRGPVHRVDGGEPVEDALLRAVRARIA